MQHPAKVAFSRVPKGQVWQAALSLALHLDILQPRPAPPRPWRERIQPWAQVQCSLLGPSVCRSVMFPVGQACEVESGKTHRSCDPERQAARAGPEPCPPSSQHALQRPAAPVQGRPLQCARPSALPLAGGICPQALALWEGMWISVNSSPSSVFDNFEWAADLYRGASTRVQIPCFPGNLAGLAERPPSACGRCPAGLEAEPSRGTHFRIRLGRCACLALVGTGLWLRGSRGGGLRRRQNKQLKEKARPAWLSGLSVHP